MRIEENKDNKDKKDEKLSSEYHTLFKKEIKEKIKTHDDGKFSKIPGYTRYRFFVNDFMEVGSSLHDVYNELWDANETDELELRINSSGGMVNEGGQFYSIIKNKFNGRTTTILDNKGYSMGAVTFCMGNKRVVTERADLMFHDYSGRMFGKGGEIEARNAHTQKFIRKFFEDVILKPGFLTKEEYKKMIIGQDYWMDAEELCKRGIATHVLKDGKEIKAKKYLKLISKETKRNRTLEELHQ